MRWVRHGMGSVLLGAAAWVASLGCEPAALPPAKPPPATGTKTERPAGLGTLSPADLKILFPESPRPFAALGSAAVPIAAEEGAVAVSNDGTLLWGDGEGRLLVVSSTRGATLGSLKVHDQAIGRIAVGPRGRVVVADGQGDLALVVPGAKSLVDGEVRMLPARHTKEVTTLAISPNGRRLVSADDNGNAYVWDLQAGTVLFTLMQEEQTGDGVVVSRGLDKQYRFIDDRRFVGFGYSGFTLWSAETGKSSGGRRSVEGALGTLVPAGDGTFFALPALGTKQYQSEPDIRAEVGRYDDKGKRLSLVELTVGDPSVGGLSPDGKLLVTANDERLRIWDLSGKRLTHEVTEPLGDERPEMLVFSPNGKQVAVFGGQGRANVVDTVSGQAATRADAVVLGYLHYGQLSAHGLAVVSDREQTRFFDVRGGRDGGRFALPSEAFRFSRDGKSLVGLGRTLWRMDLATQELLYERAGPEGNSVGDGLTATADLGRVAYARDGTITVLDGSRGSVEQTIEAKGGTISSLALSPDGKEIAAPTGGGIAIWQVRSGRKLRDTKLEDSSYLSLSGWVGDQLVVTGEHKRADVLWLVDAQSGEVSKRFETGDRCTASPDGKWLASVAGSELSLIEVATERRFQVPGPTAITLVRFSDHGEQLLVGRQGIAEVWRVADITKHGAVVEPADDTRPAVQLPGAAALARKDRYGDPLPPHALTRLGTGRGRFSGSVDRLVLRADGQTATVIDDGGRVALWDLKDGKPRREITFRGIYDVIPSADDSRLLSLSYDTLELRDGISGDLLSKVTVLDDEERLAATPDFKLAATGNRKSGLVTLWGLSPLKKRATIAGTGKGVQALALSADGRHLAVMFRGVVRLHSVAQPDKPRHEIGGFGAYSPDAVAFAPNGRRLYIGEGKRVHVVDVATGKTRAKWTVPSGVRKMASSRDGRRIVFGGFEKQLLVLDARTGKEILAVKTPTPIDTASLSDNGQRVVVGTRDHQVVLYDVATGKALHTRPVHHDTINSAVVTATGEVVAADAAGFVQRWKLQDGAFLGARRIYDYHASFFPMAGGKLLTTTGTFQILDPGSLATSRKLAPYAHGGVGGVTADGGRAVLYDGTKARIWDLTAGKELREWSPHGDFYTDGASITPDGKHILTGGTDGILKIWSPALTERQAIRGQGPIKQIRALSDGTAVFRTGSLFVRVEVPSGKERWRSDPEHSTRHDYLVSHDERHLITTDGEGIVWFDMATGKVTARLPVANWAAGSALALSPNGKRLVTANDRMLLVWDVSWVK